MTDINEPTRVPRYARSAARRGASSDAWQSRSRLGRAAGTLDAIGAVYAGYEAGQTRGVGDDLQGLASATAAGAAVGGPIGAGVAAAAYLVTNLFGFAKGRRERAKVRAERTRRTIDIEPGEVVALPYLRGRFRRELLNIYAAVGDAMPGHLTGTPAFRVPANAVQAAAVFGEMLNLVNGAEAPFRGATDLFRGPGRSDNEAYLLLQEAICAGPITGLYRLTYRDTSRNVHTDAQLRDQILARVGLPGTVDKSIDPAVTTAAMGRFAPEGTPPPPERDGDTRFLGKSYLTAWLWAAKRDYEAWTSGAGLPWFTGFGYGPALRLIARTESDPPGNPAFDEAVLVNFDAGINPVLVEYWRLREIQGVPKEQFDLPSWWAAQQQASRRLGSTNSSGQEAVFASATEKWRGVAVANGKLVEAAAAQTEAEYLRGLGLVGAAPSLAVGTGLQATSVFGTDAPGAKTRRYEFDGAIPTDVDGFEQAEVVLETMPGVIVFRNSQGKLAISLPDSERTAAAQSAGVIDDDILISLDYYDAPRSDQVVSSLNIIHADVNDDLRVATHIYPEHGSQLATALAGLEGDVSGREDITLEGVVNPYLAHSWAVNSLLMSHRKIGRITCTLDAFAYEEGDVVNLKHAEEHLDEWVRITRRQVVGVAVVFDVMEFAPIDYSFQPAAVRTVAVATQEDLSIPTPANVATAEANGVISITWALDNLRNVGGYEVECDYGDGWSSVTSIGDPLVRHATYPLRDGYVSYKFRVRAVGIVAGYSGWASTEAQVFEHNTVIYEALAEGAACPPASRGGPGSIWITPDGKVFRNAPLFGTPLPAAADVTADGVDGLLWRIDGREFARVNKPVTIDGVKRDSYVWNSQGRDACPDALTDVAGTTIGYIDYAAHADMVAPAHRRGNLRMGMSGTMGFRADVVTRDGAADLFAALRFQDGSVTAWPMGFLAVPRDPEITAGGHRVSQFEDAANDATVVADVAFGRLAKRCPGDPANPWIPEPDFGVTGLDGVTFKEAVFYRVQARTAAAPSAPAIAWTFSAGAFAVTAPAGWTEGPALPAWDAETQFLYCSAVVLSSTATSADGTTPVVCDDPGDLNVVFRRAAAQPATPGDAKGESSARTPASWTDSPPPGTLPLWQSVGRRAVGAAKFAWTAPVRTTGAAGTSYATARIYRAVARGNAAPAKHADSAYSWSESGGFNWKSAIGSGWSTSVPSAYDVHDDFLYCSDAELVSTGTSAEWSTPELCDDLSDVNVVFQRAATRPANPGGSNKRTTDRVPSGWEDTEDDVSSGTDPVWFSVGQRAAEEDEFEWSDAARLEGAGGVTITRPLVREVLAWNAVTNGWDVHTRPPGHDIVWERGSADAADCSVRVPTRTVTNGTAQARLEVSSISRFELGVVVELDGSTVTGSSQTTAWTALPAAWDLAALGVHSRIEIDYGTRPPMEPASVVTVNRPFILFRRQASATFAPTWQDVTWTQGDETRTLRFTPEFSSSRLRVAVTSRSGALGSFSGTEHVDFDDDAYGLGLNRAEVYEFAGLGITIVILDVVEPAG